MNRFIQWLKEIFEAGQIADTFNTDALESWGRGGGASKTDQDNQTDAMDWASLKGDF